MAALRRSTAAAAARSMSGEARVSDNAAARQRVARWKMDPVVDAMTGGEHAVSVCFPGVLRRRQCCCVAAIEIERERNSGR
jgi:hypothetical protein